MESVLDRIRHFLRDHAVEFREVHHAPTYSSEESAAARGESIQIGGKALLIKVDGTFRLFVMSAALRADSGLIRKHFGAKKTRFATPDELKELTGLVPGSVPPFGHPILPFDLCIDDSITRNEKIAFNAGSLTDSIVMSVEDYLRIANGTVFRFAGAESPT